MSPPVFSRELFDAALLMLGGGIDFVAGDGAPGFRIQRRPPRLELREGTRTVVLSLLDGELRSTAQTDADHTLVARLCTLIRESVDEARVRRASSLAKFEREPLHTSTTFGRAEIDALLAAPSPRDVELGDVTARIARGDWETPAIVSLKRNEHTVRISLYDDTLRTSAVTDEDRALVDEAGPRVHEAVERLGREREQRIDALVASAPQIDRDVLVEALTALTHGRIDVQPIADAVMQSTTDPRRYVAEHARDCAQFGIDAPVEDLHVIALLTHIPSTHLAYFDWKDSMHTMVSGIAGILRAGPDVSLDPERYRARCDVWDRSRDRLPALKELAGDIQGAALVELKTSGDAYAIACIPHEVVQRIRVWSTRAHIPLRSLVKKARAPAIVKQLDQVTDVKKYAVTARFSLGDVLEHPTFGRGQVLRLVDNKVVVRFRDGERTLLHGKT